MENNIEYVLLEEMKESKVGSFKGIFSSKYYIITLLYKIMMQMIHWNTKYEIIKYEDRRWR
jgi:hypothetical protein